MTRDEKKTKKSISIMKKLGQIKPEPEAPKIVPKPKVKKKEEKE